MCIRDSIRGNGNWLDVVDNIKEIQQIKNVSRVVGAVAVQVSNVLILDKMIEEFLDNHGIVFYTNMVNYPTVLSIQTLPNELKVLAINKLKAVREKVPTFKLVKEHPILEQITYNQIDGVINYILAKNLNHLWSDTVEFNRRLDTTRSQSFIDVTPEFKDHV